jgi:hypothetical protein
MPYQIDDIRDACRVIGSKERQSGEKAFPEVGTIIAECERQSKMRRTSNRSRCLHCSDGMVVAFSDAGESHVEPCGMCGGPKWLADSIQHNRGNMRGAA